VGTALGSAGAQAQESAASEHGPSVSFEAQLGLGAPLGLAGGAVEIAGDRLALSAGGGLGVSGPQVAVTARYRFRLARIFNISVGAGVSAGPYEWVEPLVFDNPARKHWDTAFWANGELGFEIGWPIGFHARPFLGVGSILNRQAGVCVGDTATFCQSSHSGDGFILPYAGIAIAYAIAIH
jgi:hypothetical protein